MTTTVQTRQKGVILPWERMARLKRLRELVDAGADVTRAAQALGISVPAMTQWLQRNDRATLTQLKSNRKVGITDPAELRKRLELCAAIYEAGINPITLAHWAKKYAPNAAEVAQALEELEPSMYDGLYERLRSAHRNRPSAA